MVDKLNCINNNSKCKLTKQFYQNREIERFFLKFSAYSISLKQNLDSKIQIDGITKWEKYIYHANII